MIFSIPQGNTSSDDDEPKMNGNEDSSNTINDSSANGDDDGDEKSENDGQYSVPKDVNHHFYTVGTCEHDKFEVKKVPGDGNCMFHAVIRALNLQHVGVSDLKKTLADHTSEKYPLREDFIETIRSDGEYGDEEVLHELSDILSINICVHYVDNSDGIAYLQHSRKFPADTIHFIFKIPPEHYDWLQLKPQEIEKLQREKRELQQQLEKEREGTTLIMEPFEEMIKTTIRIT